MYGEISEKDHCVYLYESYEWKDLIKTIQGRRWHADKKAWSITYTKETVNEANRILNISIDLPPDHPGSKETAVQFKIPYLYDHQKKSVRHLVSNKYSADLSQPGTGKTLTAIELLFQRGAGPVLIICPRSIMEVVWQAELMRVLEERGRDPKVVHV